MFNQLQENNSIKKNDKKIMIFSVLPKSWSTSKLQAEFGATGYVGESSKKIVQKDGILTKPKQQQRECLLKETTQLVYEFF